MSESQKIKRRRVSRGQPDSPPRFAAVTSSIVPTDAPKPFKPQLEELEKLVMVDLQTDDANDAAPALRQLFHLVAMSNKNHVKNRNAIRFAGGHGMVIVAMKRHQYNEQVQMQGCRFITQFSLATEEFALVDIGAFEAVANAMRFFPESVDLNLYACSAATALFQRINQVKREKTHPLGSRFALELDGISMVLQAMKRSPDSVVLYKVCCCCLQHLLNYGDEAKEALKKGGAASLVSAAIEKFPEDDDLQEAASDFMVAFFGGKKET